MLVAFRFLSKKRGREARSAPAARPGGKQAGRPSPHEVGRASHRGVFDPWSRASALRGRAASRAPQALARGPLSVVDLEIETASRGRTHEAQNRPEVRPER